MSVIDGRVDDFNRAVVQVRWRNPEDLRSESGLLGALIDTGASVSAISEPVAWQLRLNAKDVRMIGGAHGVEPLPVYVANLEIPDLGVMMRDMRIIGTPPMDDLDAVLGMDVLTQYTFKLYPTRQFTLSA